MSSQAATRNPRVCAISCSASAASSGRAPSDRAFEDRQTQMRDYYNYAAEQTASVVFRRARASALEGEDYNAPVAGERWTITSDYDRLSMPSIPT